MNLKEIIESDFLIAFKSKNEVALGTLRMLKSSIKNKEIELIRELSEEELVKLIFSEIKKRRDSASQFESGNRLDLAEKEKAEIIVLEKYLPEMMSSDEIKKIICDIINEKGIEKNPSSFGTLMKLVMERVDGKAEGSTVSQILKEELK